MLMKTEGSRISSRGGCMGDYEFKSCLKNFTIMHIKSFSKCATRCKNLHGNNCTSQKNQELVQMMRLLTNFLLGPSHLFGKSIQVSGSFSPSTVLLRGVSVIGQIWAPPHNNRDPNELTKLAIGFSQESWPQTIGGQNCRLRRWSTKEKAMHVKPRDLERKARVDQTMMKPSQPT